LKLTDDERPMEGRGYRYDDRVYLLFLYYHRPKENAGEKNRERRSRRHYPGNEKTQAMCSLWRRKRIYRTSAMTEGRMEEVTSD
jgi:hypothetical protein